MKNQKHQNLSMAWIKGYLKQRGIPPAMFDSIRLALIDDALRNSDAVRTDRIFVLVALMLHDAFGFGVKRISKGLHAFDELNGRFTDTGDGASWPALMEELRDKTGLIISTNTEDRIAFEYIGGASHDD